MKSVLNATEVHKTFGPTIALAGASVRVAPGEIVAIMGPSGSGKSTLMHCAAGIMSADAGSIEYQGQEITGMSDTARSTLRREEFGFVFQFGQLVPELTCLENVALSMRISGVGRKVAQRRATEWLERVEVGDIAAKRPGEISGGQAQRVAVARALVTSPRVIFADEPTGALDSINGEEVMKLLSHAAKETSAAVLLVTHEPRVAAYSDREVVVRDGRTPTREPVA